MNTNIIHNDDICNYFLKNQQFIFNSLGNCRECRVQTGGKSAVRTGEGPVVYEPAGGKEREGGRMAGREAGRQVGREAAAPNARS